MLYLTHLDPMPNSPPDQGKRYDGPCGDPYCYRGTYGSGFAGGAGLYKDGPCAALDCQWPKELQPRPHYTDYPPHVIKVN